MLFLVTIGFGEGVLIVTQYSDEQELGVYQGASIKMWGDYSQKSQTYGGDINDDCKKYENGNRHVLVTDLSE